MVNMHSLCCLSKLKIIMFRLLLTPIFFLLMRGEICCAKYFKELYSHQPRIWGGENTTIEEHPYQLMVEWLIQDEYMPACAASLIKSNLGLTTATCAIAFMYTPIRVRAGSTYPQDGGIIANVTKAKIHPKFNKQTIEYDVGVIVLNQNLPLGPTIQTIPVQLEGEIVDGSIGCLTGWGMTASNNFPPVLQKLDTPKVNQEVCEKAYENEKYHVKDSMVCFGLMEGGKTPCYGDNGDPLVINGKQVGIVSWGNGCDTTNHPSVYTKLPNKEVADHIKKCMEDY